MSDAKVIILGGSGFIGRNMVQYLLDNALAGYIRPCDKVLPPTAFLGGAHLEAFESDKVEFKQANLTSAASIKKMFDVEGGFDVCINLAAETKYSQSDEVYQEKIVDLTKKCIAEAKATGVKKWIEVSTCQLYDAGKKASKEGDKINPWTKMAKYKLQSEEVVKESGIDYAILRPATVYGPGDVSGVAPRLICGAVYKHLGEKMKFLWSKDMRINTVHVHDMCKAIWHAYTALPSGSLFNVADKSDTTQGSLNAHIEAIFGIQTGFVGNIPSKVAVKAVNINEAVNEKHLKPWSDACREGNILNTPLTPYLDPEILYNNPLSIDGTAIEATGFTYDVPTMSEEKIREVIRYFQDQNLFPEIK